MGLPPAGFDGWTMQSPRKEVETVPARLGLWDAVSLILGIIIGVGIFATPGEVFKAVPGPWSALGVWALGGLLALIGAFCFAELSTAYPRSGGEYVYLSRAFGRWMSYLFAWAQLGVIRTGSIAAVAYVFADNVDKLWGIGHGGRVVAAALSIVVLTVINILGVVLGTATQNVLTILKIIGLGGIIYAGFSVANWEPPMDEYKVESGWFASVMVFVLWTYAGWHEAAYVAAEVRNARRNLPRALILGTAFVTVIYLLVNAAYLLGLGFEKVRVDNVAVELLRWVAGKTGADLISILIMVSALGAINGSIFTTARIYSEFGADHRVFVFLSRWSPRWQTPVRALVVQGAISLLLTVVVGLWFGGTEGFDALVFCTAAVFWLFFCLTGVALFVLRAKDPHLLRPFRVPLYPVLPAVFCAWCGYMVVGLVVYDWEKSMIGFGILALGIPFLFWPGERPPSRPVDELLPTPGGERLAVPAK